MRVPVRFDHSHVQKYYRDFSRIASPRSPIYEHHVDCLTGPISSADIYFGLIKESISPAQEKAHWPLLDRMHYVASKIRSNIPNIFSCYPPDKHRCRDYSEAVDELAHSVPDELAVEGGKALLRDCDAVIHMANAVFSPEPLDPEIFEGLRSYHKGKYPEIFQIMRRRHERPVVPV